MPKIIRLVNGSFLWLWFYSIQFFFPLGIQTQSPVNPVIKMSGSYTLYLKRTFVSISMKDLITQKTGIGIKMMQNLIVLWNAWHLVSMPPSIWQYMVIRTTAMAISFIHHRHHHVSKNLNALNEHCSFGLKEQTAKFTVIFLMSSVSINWEKKMSISKN